LGDLLLRGAEGKEGEGRGSEGRGRKGSGGKGKEGGKGGRLLFQTF